MVTVDSGSAVPRPVRGWIEMREQTQTEIFQMNCCPYLILPVSQTPLSSSLYLVACPVISHL
jgi:hypothetical protein